MHPSETGDCCDNVHTAISDDPIVINSTKEIVPQCVLEEAGASEFIVLKKCFLCTTCIVMHVVGSNTQHIIVLHVLKRLIFVSCDDDLYCTSQV